MKIECKHKNCPKTVKQLSKKLSKINFKGNENKMEAQKLSKKLSKKLPERLKQTSPYYISSQTASNNLWNSSKPFETIWNALLLSVIFCNFLKRPELEMIWNSSFEKLLDRSQQHIGFGSVLISYLQTTLLRSRIYRITWRKLVKYATKQAVNTNTDRNRSKDGDWTWGH